MVIRFGQDGFCEHQPMPVRRKKTESSPADSADALEIGGLPTTAERLRAAAELL